MPFPADWASDRCWPAFLHHHPDEVRRALGALRSALPARGLFGQDYSQHPLGADYVLLGGRWRLLEAGAMLARLQGFDDYPARLLARLEYVRACAELAGGLLMTRLGFEVVRDPVNAGRKARDRLRGPDWLASFGAEAFGVEVKCPASSEQALARASFASQVMLTTMEGSEPADALSIQLDPNAVASATRGAWINRELTVELALGALMATETEASATTALGKMERSRTWMVTGGFDPDEDHEADRLRVDLEEAADQLRRVPQPGIVIVDTSYDPGLMARALTVSDVLQEPWARDIAAIAFVARTLPGFIVTWVLGPRGAELLGLLLRRRLCRRGHFHVDTLGLRPRCDYEIHPAICPASVASLVAEHRRR